MVLNFLVCIIFSVLRYYVVIILVFFYFSFVLLLINVSILVGQMPIPSLLVKYDLLEFKGIMESVKEGNLHQLNQVLSGIRQ